MYEFSKFYRTAIKEKSHIWFIEIKCAILRKDYNSMKYDIK